MIEAATNKPTPTAEPSGSGSAHAPPAEGEPALLPLVRLTVRHILAGTLVWLALGVMLFVLGVLPSRPGPGGILSLIGFCLLFFSPVFGTLTAVIYVGRKNAARIEWNESNCPLDLRYCEKCGYSLRGLTSRRCPECGQVFRAGDDGDADTRTPRASEDSSSQSV